jgi:hypothetical protein
MKSRDARLRVLFSTPIAPERLRILPGIGGPLAPVSVVGLSHSGHPLVKVETELVHVDEAATFVRVYLSRRDREGQR